MAPVSSQPERKSNLQRVGGLVVGNHNHDGNIGRAGEEGQV